MGKRLRSVGFTVQSLSSRLSSYRSADAAESRLPAGGSGAGQLGGAALRPRHLHGQVHREAVQPDRLLLHHDDRWDSLTAV